MASPTARPVFVLAFEIGVAAGLRSATAPAAILCATRSTYARAACIAAGGELVADKLPFVPARSSPAALAVRLGSGGWSGRMLALARDGSATAGIIAGIAGALVGSYGGEAIRGRLVAAGFPDPLVAIAEDAATIGIAWDALRI